MNKIKEWKKSIDIRSSVPTFSKNIFKQEFDELKQETENLSITQKLNSNLLKYKEIKMLVKKTGISPAYFVYILFFLLIVIFIGYFEYYLTVIIATLYPLYISIKTLQGGEKEDRVQWLTYWVVYSVFIILESVLGIFLQYIPMYFFVKVIFLLVLFLPQYNGAAWVYEHCLKHFFNKYEEDIIVFSNNLMNKIKSSSDDKKTN